MAEIKNKLKYDKSRYVGSGIFSPDEDEKQFSEKLIVTRKQHECCVCGKKIPVKSYAVYQSCFLDSKPVSCYICTKCIESWIKETDWS